MRGLRDLGSVEFQSSPRRNAGLCQRELRRSPAKSRSCWRRGRVSDTTRGFCDRGLGSWLDMASPSVLYFSLPLVVPSHHLALTCWKNISFGCWRAAVKPG